MQARILRRHAIAPLAALALLGAAPATAPAPAPRALDGYMVTQRITSEGDLVMSMTMRIKVAQGRIRLELDSPDMPQQTGGMYMLMRDDGRITAVVASQGMAVTMDPSMITGQMMGTFAPPTISDVSVSVDDLGAGEPILTYATRKYRVHMTYKMKSATGQSSMDSMMEMSVSSDIPGLADGLQKFTESFGNAFGGLAGGSTRELSAALMSKMPKGYTLKAVIKSVETPASGPVRNSTSTIDVTGIAKASMEASEFEVPAGIQVMDLAQMMGGRGGR